MTVSIIPPHAQEAGLDQQQTALHQAPSEAQVCRDLSGSTLAEGTVLLHGDVMPESRSGMRSPSCCHTETTKCSQGCESVYYHKITPRVYPKTKSIVRDGCIFSYFGRNFLKSPTTKKEPNSLASDIGAESAGKNEVENDTGNIPLAEVLQLETATSEAALPEDNEDVMEPGSAQEAKISVLRAESEDHGTQWKRGVQLPTSDPNSEDNLRVQRNLAYNLFIPDLEGIGPSPILPCSTQKSKASKAEGETRTREAPAEGPVPVLSPALPASSTCRSITLDLRTANEKVVPEHDIRQDKAADPVVVLAAKQIESKESIVWHSLKSKPESPSPTTSPGTIFGNMFREAAKKLAPLKSVPNLTKPDLSWVPETPVSFTSFSCTSSKGDLTPPRSAGLPESKPNQASNTNKVAQPALKFGDSTFNQDFNPASTGLNNLQSFSSSSSPGNLILRPSADSREDSPKKAGAVNVYPKNLPEPEIPLQSQDGEQPGDRACCQPAGSRDEKNTAQAQQLRRKVEAAILKEQIKRAFEAENAKDIQETTVPKASKEKKTVHEAVAASKTSISKTEPQAAKAQRESKMAPSAAVGNQARQMGHPIDDEFTVQTGPTKREKRTQAFRQSRAKKLEEQAAVKERTKIEEERRLAEKAAAPVLSAAAKRRSRAKRNAEGKSWADVARK